MPKQSNWKGGNANESGTEKGKKSILGINHNNPVFTNRPSHSSSKTNSTGSAVPFKLTAQLIRNERPKKERISKKDRIEKIKNNQNLLKDLNRVKKVFRFRGSINYANDPNKAIKERKQPDSLSWYDDQTTEQFKKLEHPEKFGEVFFVDKDDLIIAHVTNIPPSLINDFESSTIRLQKDLVNLGSKYHHHGVRGYFNTFHLTVWHRSHPEPFLSISAGGGYSNKEMVNEKRTKILDRISLWRIENDSFFSWFRNMLSSRIPEQWDLLSSIVYPKDIIPQSGILKYPGFALNFSDEKGVESSVHKDIGDVGMASVVSLGSFTGGDLIFGHPFNKRVPFPRGKIVTFRADIVPHWNSTVIPTPIEERDDSYHPRMSVVFFTCGKLYDWSEKKKEEEIEKKESKINEN